ncbi:uncharacterized protein LOC144064930 [Stigmatopora argus]
MNPFKKKGGKPPAKKSNAAAMRKCREKIKNDPGAYHKYLEKERERYQKRKAQGKIPNIHKLSEREQRQLRRKWKLNQRKQRSKKFQQLEEDLPSTPPPSPDADEFGEPQPGPSQPSTQKKAGRRKTQARDRKAYRTITKNNAQIKQYQTEIRKLKRKISRMQNAQQLSVNVISDSPASKAYSLLSLLYSSAKLTEKQLQLFQRRLENGYDVVHMDLSILSVTERQEYAYWKSWNALMTKACQQGRGSNGKEPLTESSEESDSDDGVERSDDEQSEWNGSDDETSIACYPDSPPHDVVQDQPATSQSLPPRTLDDRPKDLTYQVAALTDTQDRQDILEDQPARQKDQPANEHGASVSCDREHLSPVQIRPFANKAALSDYDSLEESTEIFPIEDEVSTTNLKLGDFVLVKYCGKKSVQHFVGKIIQNFDEDDEALVQFMRRKSSVMKKPLFVYPEMDDLDDIHIDNIVMRLPPPTTTGGTSRTGKQHVFDVDLGNYNC